MNIEINVEIIGNINDKNIHRIITTKINDNELLQLACNKVREEYPDVQNIFANKINTINL